MDINAKLTSFSKYGKAIFSASLSKNAPAALDRLKKACLAMEVKYPSVYRPLYIKTIKGHGDTQHEFVTIVTNNYLPLREQDRGSIYSMKLSFGERKGSSSDNETKTFINCYADELKKIVDKPEVRGTLVEF